MVYSILGLDNEVIGHTNSIDPKILNHFYGQIRLKHPGRLKNEFFEILTPEGDKTGKLKLRDLIHKDGDWHGAFQFHVYTIASDGIISLLLQKRASDKDLCPDKLDTLVGGHFAPGEEVEEGVREIKEEVGLDVDFSDLTYLGKRIQLYQDDALGINNREVQDVTVYRCDQPLDAYTLQEEEVAAIMKVRIDDFIDLMMDRLPEMEVEDGIILAKGNVEKYIPRITADDMWPSPHDDYALKTALIVRNIANGFKVPEKPYMKDVTELF